MKCSQRTLQKNKQPSGPFIIKNIGLFQIRKKKCLNAKHLNIQIDQNNIASG